MADKKPTIETLVDGYDQRKAINKNFKAIRDHFVNFLSRNGATPNAMQVNLDLADANVENVNETRVTEVLLNNNNLIALLVSEDNTVLRLAEMELKEGDLITYYDGQLQRVPVGANGHTLYVNNGRVAWGDVDTDTDTDTVGVTVQEDGVDVAENVTEINFVGYDTGFVTSPAANEAEVDLTDPAALGFPFQDVTNLATNFDINGSLADWASSPTIDLVNDLGYDLADITGGSALNINMLVTYTARYFGGVPGFEHSGSQNVAVRFRNNGGGTISEPRITYPIDNVEFKTVTVDAAVPAFTRYIDVDAVASPNAGVTYSVESRERRVYRT